MSKILDVSKLREHNQSSLVITLTEPARELGLKEGDYVKIIEKDSQIQLVPIKKATDEDEQEEA